MENVGYNMKSNLKYILEMMAGEQQAILTKEEKSEFVQSLKNFSAMSESVYGKGDLQTITERVRNIIERAEMIVNENSDWFDKVSMNRHLKELNNSYKTFEATSQEMSQLQERLAMAYEDIGQQLNKYFDVE
jgi:hypothetical protein|tara:strand:- start:1060 stop:1455 length:396 start_codon:yes stop_codon:yes gene_type:complete